MENIPISVIMATYKGGKYLREQLDTIVSQTLKPTEIIVCDDRSDDNTVEILKNYADKGLLKYVVNENNLGVINNFKKGVSLAKTSNFIAFSDQDDLWAPDKLMKLAEIIINETDISRPAMVFSDLSIINKQGDTLNPSLWNEFTIDPGKQTFKTLLTRNIVPGCAMLINSKMRDEFLTMPDFAYMHDAWITFVAYTFKNYAYVKQSLVYYRQHESNVTYSIAAAQPKIGIFDKVVEYGKGILLNEQILAKEIQMAGIFLNKFQNILQEKDKEDFIEFLKLKNRNFLFKKLHIRAVNNLERP